MADFTHLHVHTLYSLLEGAIRIDPLMEKLKEEGMNAVAMTDTVNLFGAIRFYKAARKNGIKPIFGAECFVDTKNPKIPEARIVLLAADNEGYKNLSGLLSKAHLEGHGHGGKNPRITKKDLADNSRGLFALSSFLEGEPGLLAISGDNDAALESVREYKKIFGKGCYNLEIQHNTHPDRTIVLDLFKEISRDLKVPLVATNNCHYLYRKEARAHDALLAIQHQVFMDDMRKMRPVGDGEYLRSFEEMLDLFEDVPDAVYRSAEIAEMCNVKIKLGDIHLPSYPIPDGYDIDGWFRKSAHDGLEKRIDELSGLYQADRKIYTERLDTELDVIIRMGFAGYFLIVQEFINWAKNNRVPVGPGRGSGAGSLVAYALRITDIDPIPLGLLFERFLNPERVSMPDFDVDFCMNRRDEVIDHVTRKYGKENVGHIITFGQLKARSVIRDVARVMKLPVSEGDRIAKLVSVKAADLSDAIRMEPRLKEMQEDRERPIYRELLDIALTLEGLNRQAGIHAAGVVIGDKPLNEYVPLYRGNEGEIVTQFDKDNVEEAGLIKFDFLGLKTLTVIDDAVSFVNRDLSSEEAIDIEKIPLDDPDVYRLVSNGDTTGVFQFESHGFKEMLRKLKPDRFTDIVAAGALYRPGPLESGMVNDYIERKHGRASVSYPHPSLEDILKETYGVIVYQEQVMRISQVLAGYTLGRADQLRRAMGKKKKEVMDEERPPFVTGSSSNGVNPKVANEIFDLMAKFASYGFNKSHSAAYGLISYQTAWLKTHFPVEFMAALLTSEKDKTDNLSAHIAEIRSDMKIEVLPPDINESQLAFDVASPKNPGEKKRIRFGLGAIKGVGDAAIESILEAREEEKFRGLFDFCERVDLRRANRKTIEVLINSGCFDYVGLPRWRLVKSLEKAIDRGVKAAKDRASGQTDLFSGFADAATASGWEPERHELYVDISDDRDVWTERELLNREKGAIGFYLSGHPLDRYAGELSANAVPCTDAARLPNWRDVTVGGIISNLRERYTRKGDRMADFTLEDAGGSINCVCFTKSFMKCEDILKSDDPVIIQGKVKQDGNNDEKKVSISVDGAEKLEDVRARESRMLYLSLSTDEITRPKINRLIELLESHPGRCRFYIKVREDSRWEAILRMDDKRVYPADELLSSVDRLFGRRVTYVN